MRRAVLLVILLAPPAFAQPATTFVDWLVSKNVQIRQTFDGSKDEQKPAVIEYTDPSTADADYHVDLGVKITEIDIAEVIRQKRGRTTETNYITSLFPTVEWHRLTTPKKVNTLGAKLNFDYAYGKLRLYDRFDKEVVVPGAAGKTDWGRVVFLKSGGTNDQLTDAASLEGTLGFTLKSNKDWYPNAITTIRGIRVFRWAPILALDTFSNKALFLRDGTEAKDVDVTFARFQGSVSILPLNWNNTDEFELLAEYTYYHHLGGDERVGGLHLFIGQANWYLDRNQRVAIGYTYERGENPIRKFQRLRQSSIGLKLKL